jgi:branched-chain amino acid transport system permease protein
VLGQQIVNGLVLGAVYCLFSVGFNLIFGVMHVINIAYGFYFAFGAYCALLLSADLHLPLIAVMPLTGCATGLFAAAVDCLLLAPLKDRESRYLTSLIMTMGATLFLTALCVRLFGVEARRFPVGFGPDRIYRLGMVTITGVQLLILALTPVLIGALFVLLKSSRLGIVVRATADNERAALLMGVNPAWAKFVVSFTAGFLGGIAGLLIGLNVGAVHPYMGEFMMLQGFAIVIIGGLGSLPGAAIAGLGLGMVEILVTAYGSSMYCQVITFSLLLVTLWFFPSGLSPQIGVRRP